MEIKKKVGEREGMKGKVVGRGEGRGKGLAQVAVFSFRFTSLVERSAGCIPQETQRCRNKEQRERGRTTLRHFNWILLNFDSDPHSCNCNKLYLLLLLIGLA